MQSTRETGLAGTPSRPERRVVVLGTGGTIAGVAASPHDNIGYVSAQAGVAQLVGSLATSGVAVEPEQISQIDSKDMDAAIWRRLAVRSRHHLARADVAGVVITHGTDTLEETAYILHRVLAPLKPIVLTGAMRPASSLQADGPQNLQDAIAVASSGAASGVLVAFAGTLHAGAEVRKVHPYRLDAFSSGDAGPLARIEDGALRMLRAWPATADGLAADAFALDDDAAWPAVEIVTSCGGTSGLAVRALVAAGVRGIVVASTGNGTVHRALEAALLEAVERSVAVLRSTRCLDGRIIESAGAASAAALPSAGGLTPVQARIELMLRLMERDAIRRR